MLEDENNKTENNLEEENNQTDKDLENDNIIDILLCLKRFVLLPINICTPVDFFKA